MPGRQQRDDGRPGGDPFARAIQRIGHESRRGRGLRFLVDAPLRLRERVGGHLDLGRRGGDFVAPRRQVRDLDLLIQLGDTPAVAVARRQRLVPLLRRQELVRDELLRAHEIRFALAQRRLCLRELRVNRGDFRRPPRLLEIGERCLRLPHAGFSFGARRALLLALERKQRHVLRDLRPARDGKVLQRAGKRRGDAHVFAFDIPGITRSRRFAACCERAYGDTHQRGPARRHVRHRLRASAG